MDGEKESTVIAGKQAEGGEGDTVARVDELPGRVDEAHVDSREPKPEEEGAGEALQEKTSDNGAKDGETDGGSGGHGTPEAGETSAGQDMTVGGDKAGEDPKAGEETASGGADATEKAEGPKLLDLAFGMDCTGSMGSYIASAQKGIRSIVEEIVSKEAADVKLALVEYRDHPPQDSTFVTRVHDFTQSVREMKGWLDACRAAGGGDGPEAVADALHQILKLSWRANATKICVFISDAPPHGLDASGDGFPNGCPDGLDPMEIVGQMAEKGITLYQVGCEPAINRYKEFFTGLAHVTGGQYVPLRRAELLAKVIIGGAQEEISLQRLMEEVNQEVEQEVQMAAPGALSSTDLSSRVYSKLASRGHKSKKMMLNQQALSKPSKQAKEISYATNMVEAKTSWSKCATLEEAGSSDRRSRHSVGLMSSSGVSRRKKSGGMFDGLKSWMFGSKDDTKEGAPIEDACLNTDGLAPAAACAAPPVLRSEEDTYDVMDNADLGEEQVYRMVQKSVMQNKLRSKMRRDSDSD